MRVFIFLLFSISLGVCKGLELNPTSIKITTATPDSTKANVVKQSDVFFQSNDEGKTWQDISATLPENIKLQHIYNFGDDYYMVSQKGDLYQSKSLTKGDWQQEMVLSVFGMENKKGEGVWRIFSLKTGIYATIYEKGFYKKVNKNLWIPMHEGLKEKVINSMVETADGAIAVSTPSGIYKSKDAGKTWQQVLKQEWVFSLCENNGILIACSPDGLIRSTDNGEHWDLVLADKGVSYNTGVLEGRFTAIRGFDPNAKKSLVKCSYTSPDAGKNWQCIDGLFSPIEGFYDIKKIGTDLYCGHKNGIYRSNDNGITWQLILPMKKSEDYHRLEVIPSANGIFVARVFAGC